MLDTPTPHHISAIDSHALKLVLHLVRRMAAHGIDDAHAAQAAFGFFGLGYRRPLILIRALILEMARGSHRRIRISPCCSFQMTDDEALLIDALIHARPQNEIGHWSMRTLLGGANHLPALSAAMACHDALADMGHPVG